MLFIFQGRIRWTEQRAMFIDSREIESRASGEAAVSVDYRSSLKIQLCSEGKMSCIITHRWSCRSKGYWERLAMMIWAVERYTALNCYVSMSRFCRLYTFSFRFPEGSAFGPKVRRTAETSSSTKYPYAQLVPPRSTVPLLCGPPIRSECHWSIKLNKILKASLAPN